jgi:hypothetical protein
VAQGRNESAREIDCMKSKQPFLAGALFLVAAGCDSLDTTQYVVRKASGRDQNAIAQTVDAIAGDARLENRTDGSKVAQTLRYYLEPIPHFPVSLGVRIVKEDAVIDLSCFHPGVGKTSKFKEVESRLTLALSNEFGVRLATPEKPERVPLESKSSFVE